MLTISNFAIAEKNKVSQLTVWIRLVEITWPNDGGSIFRATSNNEDVIWNGHTWFAYPMVIGDIVESLYEIPQCTVEIGNIDRAVESSLLDYIFAMKTDGTLPPIQIRIMTINSGNLANTVPEISHTFEILNPEADDYSVLLPAGVSSPFKKRFPPFRILKNQCQIHKFKRVDCGYSGSETSCDRTLATCRTLGNSDRILTFPGVGDDLYRGQ